MAGGGRKAEKWALALHEPRWLISGGLAAVATGLVCWPAWPGYMSYDSLLAWTQAVQGVSTRTWPPLHSYLFGLSRAAGAGPGGLFVVQTFILMASALLVLNLLSRRAWLGLLLGLGFLASFVWVTPQLGVLLNHWRDVTMTSFAMLGLALWLLGAKWRSLPLVAAAALAFGASLALRYNAPALLGFLLALMVWRPFLAPRPSPGARFATLAAVVVSLGLAWASTEWRLPDLRRLPPGENAMITQQFDLLGISACAGEDLLPPGMSGGAAVSARAIARGYDPRHFNLSISGANGGPKLSKLPPTDANARSVSRDWRAAIAAHPVCYLRHRVAVAREQLGMTPGRLFYPTHGAVDPNPYGLRLAHPATVARLNAWILEASLPMQRRPFWLYLAAGPLVLAAAWARREQAALLGALLAGAYGYVGLLFLAGPAADARYIFPSSVVCVLAILASLGALLPRRIAG